MLFRVFLIPLQVIVILLGLVILAVMYLFGLGRSYVYVIVKNIILEIFDFWSDNLDKKRAKHTQILGVTGCGKSSLVEYLIDSNIRKKQGFLLVEPHGELAYRVLHNKRFRIGHSSGSFKNLVYLDFDNNPPAFNIFRLPLPQNPTRKQVFIDGLSSDIADALSTNMKPEPSDAQLVMLRNLLIGCFHLPDATFLDLIHFLKLNAASDNRYCQLINYATSPVVRDYFENDFLSGNNKRTREALRYRLNNLVIPRQLYLSLCSESCSVPFDKILSEGKFVVIRASISLLGEYEAVSIGNLIHNLLSKYAFERMAVGDGTSSFFTYFDEAQYYMNQTVQKSLTGARKTGINYTLSHHELSQGDMTAAQQRTVVSETNVKFYGSVKWKDETEAQKIFKFRDKNQFSALKPGYFWLAAGSKRTKQIKVPASFAMKTSALGKVWISIRYMSRRNFHQLANYLKDQNTSVFENQMYVPGAVRVQPRNTVRKYKPFSLAGVKPNEKYQ